MFGPHQPGIVTPQLDHLSLAALDLNLDGRERLGGLLAAWTTEAERLMREHGGGLTLTFGLGPGVFDDDRLGLQAARPAALRQLPPFPGDALDPAICGGDLCIQACAAEPATAERAADRLVEIADGAAQPRWTRNGFLPRAPGDRPGRTPRDLLGFKDGTGNLRRGRELDRHVWIGGRERTWMLGGSFLVVRVIELRLDYWHGLPVAEQERVIGRHRDTGAPLGRHGEFDRLPLDATTPDGAPLIPFDAHARLAAPESNKGRAMLRRSYSYDAGLVFLAYQRDPRRQYVPVQRRLGEHDALAPFVRHVGSAVFAIPPGARPGGFIGQPLMDTAASPRSGRAPRTRPASSRPRT